MKLSVFEVCVYANKEQADTLGYYQWLECFEDGVWCGAYHPLTDGEEEPDGFNCGIENVIMEKQVLATCASQAMRKMMKWMSTGLDEKYLISAEDCK